MSDLLPYLRLFMRYRARLALGALLMLATAASGIGLLALSGWFITATAVTGALIAAGLAVAFDIYVPGGGIRAFAVSRTLSRYFERVVNHDTVLRLLRDLRGTLFESIAGLSPATTNRFRSGELLNRLTIDIDRLDGLFLRGIAPPLIALMAILLTMTLLLLGSAKLSLLVGAALIILAGATLGRAWIKGQASTTALAESNAQLRAGAIDHLQGLADLQAFGTMNYHREQLFAIERQDHALNTDTNLRIVTSEALMAAGLQFIMIGVLLFSLHLYGTGTINGPVAVMMPLAVMALLEPLGVLSSAGWHLARARASASRLREGTRQSHAQCWDYKDSHPVLRDQGAVDAVFQKPEVRFEHIELTRGVGARVLNNLSLTIHPGQCVGLLGASGSGKSSLVSLLIAQLYADKGSITVNGVNISAIPRYRLCKEMACLTQQTDLFSTTIANNLRIADSRTDTKTLWNALTAVDLAEFVRQCPDGLDTWVGESGTRLSRGQARRLALARLFLRNPSVVVLDEPFAGLDAHTAATVSGNLSQWLKGRTSLVLGHDHEALPPANRWFLLQRGNLKEVDP